MKNLSIASILTAFLILPAFTGCAVQDEYHIDAETHHQKINEWHANRIDNLKGPQGWLRLAGLYWLDEGTQTFGSGSGNGITFPEGSIDEHAGRIEREGDTISIFLNDGVELTIDGEPAGRALEFTPDENALLENDRISFTIIWRDELVGIRLYDEESPYLTEFNGIERFPVDPEWRIIAEFIPHEEPVERPITNILGQTYTATFPGKLRFEKDGETWELHAQQATDSFFINFGDATNGNETYAAGRFLYTDEPDENNLVVIDFNRAYNAPCVLTPYSTCPLPPEDNRGLDLRITAGEKMYRMPIMN